MLNKDIVDLVSKETNLPSEVIEEAYKSFYSFIRNKIIELPLKDDLTKEQFDSLRTNFNIPSIGKLYVTYERYNNLKNQHKYIQKIKEEYENQED